MEIAPPEKAEHAVVSSAALPAQRNRKPRGKYHLVVLGGGASGMAAALEAAALGARTALVEKNSLGGERLTSGTVPLQALVRSARAAYDAARGDEFGYRLEKQPHVDFAEVMNRMRCLQAGLSLQHSTTRFKNCGVDVYRGEGRFTGRNSLEVADERLEFHRAVICTGGKPKTLSLAGLDTIGYLTRETIFSLTELPKRLVVLGAGTFGCEMAQAFRRFGSEVHLISRSPGLLMQAEPAAARIVHEQFEGEGIHLHLGWTATTAEKTGDSKGMILQRRGEKKKIIADEILTTGGHQPNVVGLGLETAGVDFMPQGIVVNDRLRTTNRAIFAAGAVTGNSHCAAEAMAKLCVQNALFFPWRKSSSLVASHCTFTDPEVAQVGLTAAEALQQGILFDTYQCDMKDVDRAVLDGQSQGFVQVHCRRGTGRVLGATIIARGAGEMIGEISLLMSKRLSLRALASVQHCDATQNDAFRQIAESYGRSRRRPWIVSALQRYFSLWPSHIK